MCYNPYVVDSRPAFVTDMDDARAGGAAGDGDITESESENSLQDDESKILRENPLGKQYKIFCKSYKTNVSIFWGVWKTNDIDVVIIRGVNKFLKSRATDLGYRNDQYWNDLKKKLEMGTP
jgi:hypothetical protein